MSISNTYVAAALVAAALMFRLQISPTTAATAKAPTTASKATRTLPPAVSSRLPELSVFDVFVDKMQVKVKRDIN